MSNNTPIKLKIPRQDRSACTFFRANTEDARVWARNLPIANTRLVVQKLRSAIDELNRVEMAPDLRFDIMEVLRPSLHVALSTMSRRFLNQPLVMPEEPRQMAELADNLYGLATTGYTIVAVHTLQQRDSIYRVHPAQLLCEAIARALSFAGEKMLQTFQLQQAVHANSWLEINQLFAVAERQQVADLPVSDTHNNSNRTITAIYVQVLILGCCKPNQLRQSDLTGVFRGLQEWHTLLHLDRGNTGAALFQVELDRDQPAGYKAARSADVTGQTREIDTSGLVAHLKTLQDQKGQPENTPIRFDKDISLPPNMLDHLISALGSMSTRNFNRTSSGEMLGISIGLSSSHYHVAGRKTFEQVLYGLDYVAPVTERTVANRFLEKPAARDGWEQANPHDDHIDDEDYHGEMVDDPDLAMLEEHGPTTLDPAKRYPIYPVQMINASPGGYCMEWSDTLPAGARTGDIVGIREGGRSEWVIAVIRWVSKLKDAKSLIGVELLSPKAMPYGARIQQKRGVEAAARRVLLLPEIKLVGQPHTLITPRAGFKERQKVTLVREGEEFLVQLLRQISATGNFSQFDFRYIKHLEQVVAEDKSSPLDSAYDSLWSSI